MYAIECVPSLVVTRQNYNLDQSTEGGEEKVGKKDRERERERKREGVRGEGEEGRREGY